MISDSLSAIQSDAVNSATSISGDSQSSLSSVMGKDEFLKLLTTQLRYQDPLSPEDPKDFVAQLSQFSSLEQLINVNSSIESLADLQKSTQAAMQDVQAISMLGKTIKSQGNSIMVSGGQADKGTFKLAQGAKQVSVGIYNSGGNLIRTLELGSLSMGDNTLSWDGKNSEGNSVADGTYSFQVAAKDADGQTVDVTTYVEGKVEGIQRENSTIKLRVGDSLLGLEDVVAVNAGG